MTPTDTRCSRSIPACAGKPRPCECSASSAQVHPRVCGEACRRPTRAWSPQGPSPRVRGSLPRELRRPRHRGSIPACAGKPLRTRRYGRRSGVHPRVCGEARNARTPSATSIGPSPRVRGSPQTNLGLNDACGSIPACAGKPIDTSRGATTPGVHPRVCGEAGTTGSAVSRVPGPSPRVRGSPGEAHRGAIGYGSIPACAGKPVFLSLSDAQKKVHPRVCGEAMRNQVCGALSPGPSPRVRGSH